jgi:uncharacterized membrane protein (UPF0182 family)
MLRVHVGWGIADIGASSTHRSVGGASSWSQRGQKVIRGNALVIPVEDTLLYVEPIFL